KGLERTVCAPPLPRPPAALATVRRSGGTNSLAVLDFGIGTDDADGADDPAPSRSGPGGVAVVMRMTRVRARPSRSKPIPIPILRRKVAARRKRPASARGLSGHALDLATRSPVISARAPRSSEAGPLPSPPP